MKKYSNNTYVVYIESSESQVPNRSGEPEDNNKRLNPGELSTKRAAQVRNYIKNKLPQNTEVYIIDKGAQGPAWDPKRGNSDPEYIKYQYVKLILKGSGVETTEDIKNYCSMKPIERIGSFGDPEKGFMTTPEVINLGKTQGTIKILFEPLLVPDIFITEYNGKTQTTGLIGDENGYYRLIIGTILGNYYKNKERPWWLNNLSFTQINEKESRDILSYFKNYYEPTEIRHVFPNVSVDPNMFKNNRNLIPYLLNAGQIKKFEGETHEKSNWSATIQKIPNVESVKVYAIGLIGQTRWNYRISCNQ